jgi:hypothetical protein
MLLKGLAQPLDKSGVAVIVGKIDPAHDRPPSGARSVSCARVGPHTGNTGAEHNLTRLRSRILMLNPPAVSRRLAMKPLRALFPFLFFVLFP